MTITAPILLVADPEADLADLSDHGFVVIQSLDGMDALLRIGAAHPDVLLLSAQLPDIDPVALIRTLRRTLDIPIILGAGPADAEIVMQGLAAGATACVARPYRSQELLPLIQSTHSGGTYLPPLRVGAVELDQAAYLVRLGGRVIHVPLREFELLRYLMSNPERVITKEEIARNVWHSVIEPSHNTIAVHIKRLRGRIGDDDKNPIIRTVRGLGYRIVAPDRA